MKTINTLLVNPSIKSTISEYTDGKKKKKIVLVTNIYSKNVSFEVYSGDMGGDGSWKNIVSKNIFGEAVEHYNKL